MNIIGIKIHQRIIGLSSIDYVYVLLGWNTFENASESEYKSQVQLFINNIQAAFPDVKIVLMGPFKPARDGLGADYGANRKLSLYYEALQFVPSLDGWYEDIADENKNVYHINISGQFDVDHNMQTSTRKVNTRNDTMEVYQSNGLHPAESGYLQIADAAYRSIVGMLS